MLHRIQQRRNGTYACRWWDANHPLDPDYLAYAILDAVIDGYFPVLEEYGERLEALEEEILDRPRQETILKVQAAKRDMLALRRSIWPQARQLKKWRRGGEDN